LQARVVAVAAIVCLASVSANAFCLLRCPKLPPSEAVVAKLDQVIDPPDRPNNEKEIGECKEKFKGTLEKYGPFIENGDEYIFDGVVSIYFNDRTFDPLNCQIKSFIMTRTLRDIYGNYFGDAEMTLREAMVMSGLVWYDPFAANNAKLADATLVLMAKCAPEVSSVGIVEDGNVIVYCQFGDQESITYGIVFKAKPKS
jgi:hypothetical protein